LAEVLGLGLLESMLPAAEPWSLELDASLIVVSGDEDIKEYVLEG